MGGGCPHFVPQNPVLAAYVLLWHVSSLVNHLEAWHPVYTRRGLIDDPEGRRSEKPGWVCPIQGKTLSTPGAQRGSGTGMDVLSPLRSTPLPCTAPQRLPRWSAWRWPETELSAATILGVVGYPCLLHGHQPQKSRRGLTPGPRHFSFVPQPPPFPPASSAAVGDGRTHHPCRQDALQARPGVRRPCLSSPCLSCPTRHCVGTGEPHSAR